MAILSYLPEVVTLELDREKCIGCGMCTEVCPHRVFVIESKVARIADRDACMECGACQLNCPVDAIRVESGVGCAAAIIIGALKGTDPNCDCCGDSTPASYPEVDAISIGDKNPELPSSKIKTKARKPGSSCGC